MPESFGCGGRSSGTLLFFPEKENSEREEKRKWGGGERRTREHDRRPEKGRVKIRGRKSEIKK